MIVSLATVVLLSSCVFNPFSLLPPDEDQLSRDRMAQIVDAVNSQDAAALRGMFTEYALAEYSTEIDDGVDYLLSLFPDGDVVWQEEQGGSRLSKRVDHGRKTVVGWSNYYVSSGGKDFQLFFADFTENTIDPENVGIYAMGAVPRGEAEDLALEAAFYSWGGSFDVGARASSPPGVFIADGGELSRDRAARLVDALNDQDADALRGMFTEYALAEYSTEINDGVEYLLSLFPDGDIAWQEEQGGSAVYERFDNGKRTVLLPSFYRVSSGGVDYWLFFADFTENTIHPDNVGIYAIGAVPLAEARNVVPEADIYPWTSSFDVHASSPPGIYIPE